MGGGSERQEVKHRDSLVQIPPTRGTVWLTADLTACTVLPFVPRPLTCGGSQRMQLAALPRAGYLAPTPARSRLGMHCSLCTTRPTRSVRSLRCLSASAYIYVHAAPRVCTRLYAPGRPARALRTIVRSAACTAYSVLYRALASGRARAPRRKVFARRAADRR